jgi:hypothetical protein
MQFYVLQYGYVGLLALVLFFCYRIIISSFQTSNKPFSQTVFLVCLFLIISVASGVAGYFWADKELQVEKTKESSLSIIRDQIDLARSRLNENLASLKSAEAKALETATSEYESDFDRENAMKRVEKISELIRQCEIAYNDELASIKEAFKEAFGAQ